MAYIKYFLAALLAIFFLISLIPLGLFLAGEFSKHNIILPLIFCVLAGIVSAITAYSIVNSILGLFKNRKEN